RRHTRFSRDWSSDVCSSDLQHTGRFRTGSYPIVKQDGQALPQPRSASGSRPSASQQGGREKKRGSLWIGVAAVGVLLLGSAAWYWTQDDNPAGHPPSAAEDSGGNGGDGTASAQETNTPGIGRERCREGEVSWG